MGNQGLSVSVRAVCVPQSVPKILGQQIQISAAAEHCRIHFTSLCFKKMFDISSFGAGVWCGKMASGSRAGALSLGNATNA